MTLPFEEPDGWGRSGQGGVGGVTASLEEGTVRRPVPILGAEQGGGRVLETGCYSQRTHSV